MFRKQCKKTRVKDNNAITRSQSLTFASNISTTISQGIGPMMETISYEFTMSFVAYLLDQSKLTETNCITCYVANNKTH